MKWSAAIVFLYCTISVGFCLADETADGQVVLRIKGVNNESIARIDLTHVDTGSIVKIRSGSCPSAGIDSKICLVPAPPGRYFWTRFEIIHKLRGTASLIDVPSVRRTQPGSADDSVEVVKNAINYIGDWELVNARAWIETIDRREYSVEILQEPATLQRIYEKFPDAVGQYEIYLSMLGKKAISLRDFLKLIEQNSSEPD